MHRPFDAYGRGAEGSLRRRVSPFRVATIGRLTARANFHHLRILSAPVRRTHERKRNGPQTIPVCPVFAATLAASRAGQETEPRQHAVTVRRERRGGGQRPRRARPSPRRTPRCTRTWISPSAAMPISISYPHDRSPPGERSTWRVELEHGKTKRSANSRMTSSRPRKREIRMMKEWLAAMAAKSRCF